jgi:ABC-type sugar transport system ATPase subunit
MNLKLKSISKSYGVVRALQNVSFELIEGEIHALCGENGAGKSTLMNILSGNVYPDSGEIILNEKSIQIKNQKHASELGIAIVYQQLSLFENQNVAENIFVNAFPKTKAGFIDFEKLKIETKSLLEKLKINHVIQPEMMVGDLSAGQKQMVEIAKALSKNPSILILDEPTASITANDSKTLFEIIRNLKNQGVSIIYISHRLEEIFEISDRITVLKDGKFISTEDTSALNKEKLIALMVGREIVKTIRSYIENNKVVLEVKNLSNDKLTDVSFKIHQGEIVALAGLVGAGRTEIGMTIFGAMKKNTGEISLNGEKIEVENPENAIQKKIAYVPEERKTLGLFVDMDITENVSSTSFTKGNPVFYNSKNAKNLAESYIGKFKIATPSANQKLVNLSGGNQQKVVLAKWLATNPDLLIIDEPTHGIDIGAKFEIYDLLQKLSTEGIAILLISSELSEVLAISDRVLVVKNGQITQELITKNTNETEILKWAM